MPHYPASEKYPHSGSPARYGYPGPAGGPHSYPGFDWRDSDREALYAERKHAIRERDEALAAQKQCEKDRNIDAARWYREMASEWLARYRALCLIIGDAAFHDAPKDCPRRPMTEWAKELAPLCDDIIRWRSANA